MNICSMDECRERHEGSKDPERQKFIKTTCMHGKECNGFCPYCQECCFPKICDCDIRPYKNSTTYKEKLQKEKRIQRGEIFA